MIAATATRMIAATARTAVATAAAAAVTRTRSDSMPRQLSSDSAHAPFVLPHANILLICVSGWIYPRCNICLDNGCTKLITTCCWDRVLQDSSSFCQRAKQVRCYSSSRDAGKSCKSLPQQQININIMQHFTYKVIMHIILAKPR